VRFERPDHAVVQEHVPDCQQERNPVFVEGQGHDEDEKVEVRLDQAMREVHEQGGRAQEPDRREGRPPLRAEAGHAGQKCERHDPGRVQDVVTNAVASERDAVAGQDHGVQPEDHDKRPMPSVPLVVRKRAAARQEGPQVPDRRSASRLKRWDVSRHQHKIGKTRARL
jgi:hypothetical protein